MAVQDIRKLRQQNSIDQLGAPMDERPPLGRDTPFQMTPQPEPVFRSGVEAHPPDDTPQQLDIGQLKQQVDQIYTPTNQARDRFSNYVDQYPQREEPSFMRRLVAGGMGVSDRTNPVDTMDKVLHGPHVRDVSDWKDRTTPLYQSAQLENVANANERQLAGNILTAKIGSDRIASQERIADRKADIAQDRADAYTLASKAKAAGWKIDTSGPRIKAYSATEGTKDLGPNDLSERQKIDLEGQWKVEAATALGESRERIASGQQHPDYIAKVPGRTGDTKFTWDPKDGVYKEAMEAPVGSTITRIPSGNAATPKPQTAAQIKVDRNERIKQVYDTNPEARKWIEVSPDGSTYTLKAKPTEGWFNKGSIAEDQAHWARVKQLIDTDYNASPPNTTNKVPLTTAPPAPPGWKYVQQPNGNWKAVRTEPQ